MSCDLWFKNTISGALCIEKGFFLIEITIQKLFMKKNIVTFT